MYDKYESPLSSRYASERMLKLFSAQRRIETWRKLWTELARAESALGLPISDVQVAELEAHISDIDFDCAAAREKEVVTGDLVMNTEIGTQFKEIALDFPDTCRIYACLEDHFFLLPVHDTCTAGEYKVINRKIRSCKICEGPDAPPCSQHSTYPPIMKILKGLQVCL